MRRPRKSFLIIILAFILNGLLYAQVNNTGAVGSVTIDGKVWNQVAMRPVIPFGKWGLALDLVVYFDAKGNIHSDEWDFSSSNAIKNTLIDKIYYIRYGFPGDPLYGRIGALDDVDLGYGILVNDYSNTMLYPQDRKIGFNFEKNSGSYKIEAFGNDFKENIGLFGGRISSRKIMGLPLGISIVTDRNQYLGLKDSDGDGRPNIVDDFPNNDNWWIDTDGDGLDDNNPDEWDIDGDGITDTLDSRIPGYSGEIIALDPNIFRKASPINLDNNKDDIFALAIDIGYPLVSQDNFSISLYAQMAKMIGKTVDPGTGELKSLETGLIPFGLSSRFGPARFNFEYRMMPDGRFEFNYWNRLYEIERVGFTKSTDNQIILNTKESSLGRYGPQKGYYARMTLNLASMIEATASYQDMLGDIWSNLDGSFIEDKNQTFLASLRLKKAISKLQYARAFYQQRNVPNPFKFDYTESTIIGYQLGISMGQGLVLNYIFRRSFRDLNGDGIISGENETIDITSIETSFSF